MLTLEIRRATAAAWTKPRRTATYSAFEGGDGVEQPWPMVLACPRGGE